MRFHPEPSPDHKRQHSAAGHEHPHAHNLGERHNHDHEHDHQHDHHRQSASNPLIVWLRRLFIPHRHSYQAAALDPNLATDRGMQALKISLFALLLTALIQLVIVFISGSVALLADTIHNFSDALTAIPLGLAFWLSRRGRNKRYTYGYGRAEDFAGVIIVVMIAFSAGEAIYQSVYKIIYPQPVTNLGWVAVAAVLGFIGNELVAIFRIRVGKEIGSAALVADGYHARTDGLTSLAVLFGALGVWLGFPLLDSLIGLLIGVAILGIVWNSARDIWHRMMDAVDPGIYEELKHTASHVPGVMDVNSAAIRWVGHRLWGELHVTVDCQQPTLQSHFVIEEVRHRLFHALPALGEVTVHADPCECEPTIDYHPSRHHNFLPAAY